MKMRFFLLGMLLMLAGTALQAQNASDFSGHYGEYVNEEGQDFDRGIHLVLNNDGKYEGYAYRMSVDGVNAEEAELSSLSIDPNSLEISFVLDKEAVQGYFTDDSNGQWLLHLKMDHDELNLTRR